MGSYTFRWEHQASEVFVTGTFDNWSGHSIQLDKKDTVFEKTVNLPPNAEKVPILYKFVVDGEWKHDHTGQTQLDHEGNVNNVLYPEDIKPINSMAYNISSVAPTATTVQMAGEQPLEKEKQSVPPGAFPETPAGLDGSKDNESTGGLAGAVSGTAAGVAGAAAAGAAAIGLTSGNKDEQEQTVSVDPIPASEGIGNPIHLEPGEKVPPSSTINNNTISSTARDDPSLKSSEQAEQTFGVAPIPATGGVGNPVHLAPGEKLPDHSTISRSTVDSNIKLDQASYEKADSLPPQLPPVLSPQSENEAAGASLFGGLGPQASSMIPESSMGMGKDAPAPVDGALDVGPTISSVGATSTTNQLAGQQPLEQRGVPEVVTDSQKEADVDPEASASPVAVQEKKEMESELKAKVPEEQAGSGQQSGITGAVAGGLAGAGAAAAGAAAVLREKTHQTTGTDPVSVLPESVQGSINKMNTKPVDSSAVPAQTALGGGVAADTSRETATAVPSEVETSQKEARVDPEASANPEAVHDKSDVEKELLAKVPESQATGEPAPTDAAATSATAPTASTSSTGAPQLADPVGAGLAPINMDDKPARSSGLNAPASAAAQTPATKADALQDSRDVSPKGTRGTAAQSQPTVTTGVDSGNAPATSAPVGTPRKNGPDASASTPNKRNSIIDRLKGTPDSQKTTGSDGKKKGFFSKLKEKLKQ